MHFLLLLLLIPVFYLLWLNGMLVINCKRALLYLDVRAGAPNSRKVTFSGCTGYTRRVLRLSRNCRYRFTLSCNVTKGMLRFCWAQNILPSCWHPDAASLSSSLSRRTEFSS